jgi:hypothetical protein
MRMRRACSAISARKQCEKERGAQEHAKYREVPAQGKLRSHRFTHRTCIHHRSVRQAPNRSQCGGWPGQSLLVIVHGARISPSLDVCSVAAHHLDDI